MVRPVGTSSGIEHSPQLPHIDFAAGQKRNLGGG
jgi:hypothetical protein